MLVALVSWLAATAGIAVESVQIPEKASAAAVDPVETALPSGSSELFQRRMLEWTAPPEQAPLRIKNRPSGGAGVKLDRLAITSRFGWRSDPITGVGRRHAGIDLRSRRGSAVMATGPGVVRIARWDGGYGNLVEIEHAGGVRTRYGHLSRLHVFQSEHVDAGQVIGEVGSTGHSTGPHLHYEVRVGGFAVDPLSFVGQRVPASETVWGNELHATPTWAGWSGSSRNTLPEASFR
jgi:murein DD-endopeptidase MepM/ murein hydrolase activator NlpD